LYSKGVGSVYKLEDCGASNCVGNIFVFKNDLYFDSDFTEGEEAGIEIGQCTVVSVDEGVSFYCVWSLKIEYDYKCDGDIFKAELALQGDGVNGQTNYYPITAAAGEFKYESGSVKSTPLASGFRYDILL
jgi:hypothetical protein